MRSSYAICIKYFNWTVTLEQFSYREYIMGMMSGTAELLFTRDFSCDNDRSGGHHS